MTAPVCHNYKLTLFLPASTAHHHVTVHVLAVQAQRALEVLRRPSVSQELHYKFAPALVALAPELTVQAWMDAQPPLEPR